MPADAVRRGRLRAAEATRTVRVPSDPARGGAEPVRTGTVVLINGTASAGKSSAARALQAAMPRPWLHAGLDRFVAGLPPRCFEIVDASDPAPADGFQLRYWGGTGARTEAPVDEGTPAHGDGVLVGVRVGPAGVALLAAMYRGLAATAAAGLDVVADDAIHDRRVLAGAVAALRGVPVLFVGLRLPLAEAERRERERGDRGPGAARALHAAVHAHGTYDLELDTAALDPEACAAAIARALAEGRTGGAFARLACELDG